MRSRYRVTRDSVRGESQMLGRIAAKIVFALASVMLFGIFLAGNESSGPVGTIPSFALSIRPNLLRCQPPGLPPFAGIGSVYFHGVVVCIFPAGTCSVEGACGLAEVVAPKVGAGFCEML
jgi:hypothetical protein